MTAALLLRRCRLVDPAGSHGRLVDVLLDGGAVRAVTPSGTAAAGVVPARVADLDGRWLLPGLWDEHVHLGQWAQVRRRLDVSGAASAAEAAAAVAQRVAEERSTAGRAAEGSVLVGYGFRDGLWGDAPSPELLDRAVTAAGDPERPVVLVFGDLQKIRGEGDQTKV